MKVFIASDHAGFQMKSELIERIHEYDEKIELIDFGTDNSVPCDYPIFANKTVERLARAADTDRGILICGTGIGMSIAANRNPKIRAALCFSEKMAIMSRKHNNANVIVFGAQMIDCSIAMHCVVAFLRTEFEGGRHARRLALINAAGVHGEG